MLKIFLLITAFLMLASSVSASANININVEVVVPIGNYTNATLKMPANQTTLINVSEASTTLELASSQNTSGSIYVIVTSTPLDIPSLSVSALNKYLRIEASDSIKNNLTYVVTKLYYTDEEVIASGIEEGSLGFYWWNQTSSNWEKLTPAMGWVNGAGVDTMENYVWANITHFSDYSIGGLRIPPSMEITRELPSQVKTNNKFDMEIKLRNMVDFDISNLIIKEKIPEGYDLGKEKKFSPKPYDIKFENGSSMVYWRINKLASHTNLSLDYSLSTPDGEGNYTFRADAFGFGAFNNKYAAFNVTNQEVKKPPLWKKFLEFFGLD